MGLYSEILVKNDQYFSIKITDRSYENPIKSHVLFTQADKILHPHDCPIIYTKHKITPIDESAGVLAASVLPLLELVIFFALE